MLDHQQIPLVLLDIGLQVASATLYSLNGTGCLAQSNPLILAAIVSGSYLVRMVMLEQLIHAVLA